MEIRNSLEVEACTPRYTEVISQAKSLHRQLKIDKPHVSLKDIVDFLNPEYGLILAPCNPSENFKIGTVKHTNTSYFTMVAKDDEGKLTKVPGLILENKTDARRFLEAIKRKELRNLYKVELNNAKTMLEIENNKHILDNERCRMEF